MKFKLKAYSIFEFGQRKDAEGRPHQEDCLFPVVEDLSDEDRLFILCDGMGGHDAGEVASSTVCEAMSTSINTGTNDPQGPFNDRQLLDAINEAFSALDKKDNGAEKKMGTTMTFLKLHEEGATIAHMGDSRVYHIRPGKTGEDTRILFQTEDHSLINDLIKVGELTPEEARHSNQKNVITRAMQPGLRNKPKADIHHISDIQAGDYFYMCSDGMLEQDEMESGDSLRNIFSELGGDDQNKVEILKGATDDNKDNHSAFIIHILEVAGKKPMKMAMVENSPAIASSKLAIVEDETPVVSFQSESSQKEDDCENRVRTHRKTTNQQKKSYSLVSWLLLGILLILVIVGFFWFSNKDSEEAPQGVEMKVGTYDIPESHSPEPENQSHLNSTYNQESRNKPYGNQFKPKPNEEKIRNAVEGASGTVNSSNSTPSPQEQVRPESSRPSLKRADPPVVQHKTPNEETSPMSQSEPESSYCHH